MLGLELALVLVLVLVAVPVSGLEWALVPVSEQGSEQGWGWGLCRQR